MSTSRHSVLPPGGVAYVTGGARGLGFAVACSFAREGCSAVVIVDVLPDDILQKSSTEITNLGAKCLALRCDVTDEAQVQESIKTAVSRFGRIDYAVNAAGVTGPTKVIQETDATAFHKCLQVNTTGVFVCVKHQIAQMVNQEPLLLEGRQIPQRGAIVNFASVNSIMSGSTTAAYTASKHAVNGITKAAALEYRRQNIRVNSLSPGFIHTAMMEASLTNGFGDPRLVDAWNGFESRQGRKAFSEEIGDATVLLCSPKMSLVNAHNLVCDNGFTINENTF